MQQDDWSASEHPTERARDSRALRIWRAASRWLSLLAGGTWATVKVVQEVAGVVFLPKDLAELWKVARAIVNAIDLSTGDILVLTTMTVIASSPYIWTGLRGHLRRRSSTVARQQGPAAEEPERRVRIDVVHIQSQLKEDFGQWTLWLYLAITVKQDEAAYLESVAVSWDGEQNREPNDLSHWPEPGVMLPLNGPFLSLKDAAPYEGYFVFDCGPVDASIFDDIFTLRLRFISEPKFENRFRARRSEGALQHAIEAVD